MKKILLLFLLGMVLSHTVSAHFTFRSGKDLIVTIGDNEIEVVRTALDIFGKDYNRVFGGKLIIDKGNVYVGTIGLDSEAEKQMESADVLRLSTLKEGFLIKENEGKLVVLGSDKRGTAYGILELSRMIGVSPWEWWADSNPDTLDSYVIKDGFTLMESPSVAHRGIFLNDEDWGLTPWSYLTHEPSVIKGQIGPETHARIFELLLRLRANTFWPAMHDCSVAFYLTPGNKEMADKYGIFVGTSHCEPMVRNTNAEWKTHGTGVYDYVNNRENVLQFWEERVIELAGSDNIYTLGIRGVHDSKMLGANTLEEQKDALVNVLKDQREMIAKYVNPDVEKVSQVFIPYKEVLDVYHMGLEVPEDVMLLWCDDNYGYIRHFPDEKERARKGGNGIYYHISYWGRPHDYLWLATNHPAQIYTQMKLAYDKGAKDMWIINVGDIKPAEYQIELLMDMAWNMDAIENSKEGLDKHLYNWLAREFGEENARVLLPVMDEYYRLAWIRKPEFMGNTRTEEQDPKYKMVTDLPWSEHYIRERLAQYEAISDEVEALYPGIPSGKKEMWFQLIGYPVRSAAEMNKKHLYAQLARHGLSDWDKSDKAYDRIVELTDLYNALNGGKWKNMMDYKPRRLPVFDRVPHTVADTPLAEDRIPLFRLNGNDFSGFEGSRPLYHGLGYEKGAIALPKGSSVSYTYAPMDSTDGIAIEVNLVPNHPVEGGLLRYAIAVGDEAEQVVEYQTAGRSEEWKLNVLSNQAIRTTSHLNGKAGTVRITALDEGVIIDQIKIHRNE